MLKIAIVLYVHLAVFGVTSFLGQAQAQNIPGSLDQTFQTGLGANGPVYSIEVDANQKVLIGGDFLTFNNLPHKYFVRLNSDGQIDSSFNIGLGPNGVIWDVAVRPNGEIYIAGDFTSINNFPISRIARLKPDGQLDTAFKNQSGPNNFIRSMAFGQDDKIIIGGDFTTYDGDSISRIARLNSNGLIDTTFKVGKGVDDRVHIVEVDLDGNILVGGAFLKYNGASVKRLARLKPSGILDSTFNLNLNFDNMVRWINILPNGKLIVAGYFSMAGIQNANKVVRLNSNGSIDTGFSVGAGSTTPVYTTLVQSNGKIIISGNFQQFSNNNFKNIVRVNENGSLDTIFTISGGPNSAVQALSILPGGKILIGGFFTSFNGIATGRIARLFGDKLISSNSPNLIRGKVFNDLNSNCLQDSIDTPIHGRIVVAEPGPFYGITDEAGKFEIQTDTGNYQVRQFMNPFQGIVETQICPPLPNPFLEANFGSSEGDTIANINFSNSITACPFLKISVSSNRRRRCFMNSTYIRICNNGFAPSDSQTTIHLKLPRFLNFVSSQTPFIFNPADSSYSFQVGAILPNTCKTFTLIDSVSCIPGIMGVEQCTRAWATPSNTCLPPSTTWDGVDLAVKGKCDGLTPSFVILNKGQAMSAMRSYKIYQDSLLAFVDSIQLVANDSVTITPIVSGSPNSTYGLEIGQSTGHPFSTFVTAAVSCSGSPVFPSPFPVQNEDPISDIDCQLIRDSYDPNDKAVFPKGSTPNGLVLPGKIFDFKIRFQNTGNDTAYTVVVVDTLDPGFDLSTLLPGVSSHPYKLSVSGLERPILNFKFSNIFLVDSITNPTGSNGFLTFKIKLKSDKPIGYQVRNFADIYFDFNEPVRTNTTLNTLFEPQLTGGLIDSVHVVTNVKNSKREECLLEFQPNPTSGIIEYKAKEPSVISIYNLTGNRVFCTSFRSEKGEIDISGLPKGLYLIRAQGKSSVLTEKILKN